MDEIKEISTNNFRIEKSIITFNDTLIQISNVSQVSLEPMPKSKFKFISLILFLFGIIGIMQQDDKLIFVGIVFISLEILYLIWFIIVNLGEDKYLYIYMNSGVYYYILCKDIEFLKEAIQVIEYCMNNRFVHDIIIDFENCELYNSPIILGNDNEVMQ